MKEVIQRIIIRLSWRGPSGQLIMIGLFLRCAFVVLVTRSGTRGIMLMWMSDFVFITVFKKYNKSYSLNVFSGQCNSPLGLEDKSIPDTDLTASSVYGIYYGPERARLNTVPSGYYKGAWSPRYAYRGEWIQVHKLEIYCSFSVTLHHIKLFKALLKNPWEGNSYGYLDPSFSKFWVTFTLQLTIYTLNCTWDLQN